MAVAVRAASKIGNVLMAYTPSSTPLQNWGICHAGGAHGGHHNYGKQCNPVLGTIDDQRMVSCSFCGKILRVIKEANSETV